jgi:hypothetical protein
MVAQSKRVRDILGTQHVLAPIRTKERKEKDVFPDTWVIDYNKDLTSSASTNTRRLCYRQPLAILVQWLELLRTGVDWPSDPFLIPRHCYLCKGLDRRSFSIVYASDWYQGPGVAL